MRYVIDFGAANAGGSPAFSVFKRLDTLADLAAPTIHEIAGGQYYFDWDWLASPAESVTWKATLGGIELSDVISGVPPAGTATATAGTGSTAGFTTAGTLISRVAVQVGLGAVDAFGSTDPAIVRLRELLASLGNRLLRHNWSHLVRECTLLTVAGQTTYNLPTDFRGMVDQSGWDRTSRRPLVGPISPRRAQFLKAWSPSGSIDLEYRLRGPQIVFATDPGAGKTVGFEYRSSSWVWSDGAGAADSNTPHANADVVLYDPELIVSGLRLAFHQVAGFDTTLDVLEFADVLEDCLGHSNGGEVLSLNGGGGEHFIDGFNVPATGYGS